VKRYAPFIIVGIVALVTIGAGAMLYQSKAKPPITVAKEQFAPEEKSAHVRGPADAPVTLEEYGDFQCPPCGALAGPLREIEREFGRKMRVIFRNFPFDVHQHARAAACAAEAAGLQGHFWEMHDLLYREQAAWSKAPDVQQLFESYAAMLRLDVPRFTKDAASAETKERVAADQERGSSLGVKKTPTIFVNNRELPPTSLNPDGVRKAINAALAQIPAGH
jgi:Na+:H+ antiporter, NhaA family